MEKHDVFDARDELRKLKEALKVKNESKVREPQTALRAFQVTDGVKKSGHPDEETDNLGVQPASETK